MSARGARPHDKGLAKFAAAKLASELITLLLQLGLERRGHVLATRHCARLLAAPLCHLPRPARACPSRQRTYKRLMLVKPVTRLLLVPPSSPTTARPNMQAEAELRRLASNGGPLEARAPYGLPPPATQYPTQQNLSSRRCSFSAANAWTPMPSTLVGQVRSCAVQMPLAAQQWPTSCFSRAQTLVYETGRGKRP